MIKKDNQRAVFAKSIHKHMSKNNNIWVVTGDLGFGMWDKIRSDFPNRFLNVGASEQTMMGIAVGLAISRKIPFVYSITTFLLYRSFETIRNYIDYEKIPVRLVGSGRDKNYIHDGISHWPLENKKVIRIFKNIEARWPTDIERIPSLVSDMVKTNKPWYVNLKR